MPPRNGQTGSGGSQVVGLAGEHTRDLFIRYHSIVILGSNINSETYQNGIY